MIRSQHQEPRRGILWPLLGLLAATLLVVLTPAEALGHGVTAGDKGYIQSISGIALIPFMYLGAKHMVTGYDHTAVLPAEYGVDPTGVGRLLGLTEMGKIKRALAAEAAAQATVTTNPADSARPTVASAGAAAASADTSSDRVTTIALQPGQAREIKLVMRKGALANYSWSTDRGVVSHTTHGDTLNASPGKFHEYSKGTGVRADSGVIVAVFTGNHGWYWRNRTREVVTVTLRTRGEYDELKEIK